MLGTKEKNLQEKIVELLIQQKMSAKKILHVLKEYGNEYSIQAIYDQLRILLAQHVISKYKGTYSIDNDWVLKMNHLLSVRTSPLHKDSRKNIYYCETLKEVDRIWKDVFYGLQNANDQIFIYNPEPFWHFIEDRKDSEERFYQQQEENKQITYCVIGGELELYQKYRRKFKSATFKIERSRPALPNNVHVTVIGDYILSVIVEESMSNKIQRIFQSETGSRIAGMKIDKLANQESKHKIVLERDPGKAEKLKKKLSKDFYIPK